MPLLFGLSRQALDLLAAAMNIANWRFIAAGKDYLAGSADDLPSPLQHYWSLSIEEQFYFVWPVLIVALAVLAKRMRWSMHIVVGWEISVVIAASMLGSLHFTASDTTLSYMATHTRAWQFGVGALVAVVAPLLTGLMTNFGVQIAMWVLVWAGTIGGAGGDSGLGPHHALSRAWPRWCQRSVPPPSLRPDRWPPAAGPRSGGFSFGAPVAVAGQGLLWLVSVALARSRCFSRATRAATAGRRWWA